MFAKFSPDGTRVAYVRGNNIYVERLADGRTVALTNDGSETTINGTSDWVYEEELGVRDGFRWSPDGTRIAYWQFDTTGVGIFSLINNTDALYPTITKIPVPQGRDHEFRGAHRGRQCRGRPDDVDGDPGRSAELPIWRAWSGSTADTLAIQQLNRLQNRNDFLIADAEQRRGDARLPRRVEGLGRRRRGGALDRQGPGVSVDQRARWLAARLPRAA